MTKRIFRSIFLAAMAVLLVSVSCIVGVLYSYFSQVQLDQLKAQTALAAQGVSHEGLAYLQQLEVADCRVTWINSDGEVLFDSITSSDEMENHLQREEIREALQTGYGESSRYSSTLMEETVYTAQLLPDGTVLRLSMARSTAVTLALGMARTICLVIFLSIILSAWLAHRLSRHIVQPLNQLNLDDPLSNAEYDELKPLLNRIRSQQLELKGKESELRRKQREFDAVTNGMSEGLVLMNETCNVLTMNPAAAKIMGLVRPYVGINFRSLTHADVLEPLLSAALEGEHTEDTVSFPQGDYQVAASPVRSGGKVSGLVVLMFDITEKKRLELQRREFTANVSHELKTPLHAISGYAELLKSGLVPAGDVGNFSEKIYTEAQRMIRLIEDILKLSHLDEGAADMTLEQVDLYSLAQEAVRALTETAKKANITLKLTGGSCPMEGYPQLLSAIVTNLCTNAIKYNSPGGRVDISLTGTQQEVVLTVADTGIGIEPEHRERIFERFYRVDKSRSKAVGGTGLGLSIVKHAAMIHNAKIDLSSDVGLGTTIRVTFPRSIN